MPVSSPPTFNPAKYNIKFTVPADVGKVLTVQASGALAFATPGGGGGVGSLISYASPAGASNDVNPAGFGSSVGRIEVDLTLGSANWTGLAAGTDAQTVLICVVAPAATVNTLTLNNQNAGSAAANRFRASDDVIVVFGNTLQLVYYAGSVNRWVIVP